MTNGRDARRAAAHHAIKSAGADAATPGLRPHCSWVPPKPT